MSHKILLTPVWHNNEHHWTMPLVPHPFHTRLFMFPHDFSTETAGKLPRILPLCSHDFPCEEGCKLIFSSNQITWKWVLNTHLILLTLWKWLFTACEGPNIMRKLTIRETSGKQNKLLCDCNLTWSTLGRIELEASRTLSEWSCLENLDFFSISWWCFQTRVYSGTVGLKLPAQIPTPSI